MTKGSYVGVRLERSALEAVDRLAAAHGITRSRVISLLTEALRDGRLVVEPPRRGGQSMQVKIVLGSGKSAPIHRHEGKLYAEVPATGSYKIRLHNDRSVRRLAVVSVDGLGILDGKPARRDGQGYVLQPHQTLEIPGWRRSASEVAAFELAHPEASYPAKAGQGTANVGVIGVAVYDEKVASFWLSVPVVTQTITWQSLHHVDRLWSNDGDVAVFNCSTSDGGGPQPECSYTSSQGSTTKSLASDVGTGYGTREEFATSSTAFDREDEPAEVVVLHYATRERLASWGVPLDRRPAGPNPFPGSEADCPAPPGWEG